jgi:hypothetical protein
MREVSHLSGSAFAAAVLTTVSVTACAEPAPETVVSSLTPAGPEWPGQQYIVFAAAGLNAHAELIALSLP